jgi:hypothetical protein
MRIFGLLLATPLALAAPFLAAQGKVIPGKWIVVMKESSELDAVSGKKRGVAVESLVTPRHAYDMGTFKAYAMDASDQTINKVAELDEVSSD